MNVELANSWTEKTGRNKDEPEKLPPTTKYTRFVYAAVLGDIKVATSRINGFSGWSEIRSGDSEQSVVAKNDRLCGRGF